MPLWVQALLFGLFSALSLPLGALLGLALLPSERVVAKWMGFGAGALVYAVATQLYGKTLFKLLARSPDPFIESVRCDPTCQVLFWHVVAQAFTGVLGAVGYRGLNYAMPKFIARISAPRLARMASHISRSRQISGSVAAAVSAARTAPSGEAENGDESPEGNVALSMLLGLVVDGIPESVMLGFMTNSGEVTFSFLIAIFIANFPEAFAGAAVLQRQGFRPPVNVMLWTSVFLLTGLLAMAGSAIMPLNVPAGSWLEHRTDGVTVVLQGFTGGAMLAMVATAMMPEAYHGSKGVAGDMFVLGFVSSVLIDGLGARFGKPQSHLQAGSMPRRNETLYIM